MDTLTEEIFYASQDDGCVIDGVDIDPSQCHRVLTSHAT